jgi:hypothetical protein
MTDRPRPPRRTLTTQIFVFNDDLWLEWGELGKGAGGGFLVWYVLSGKKGEQWHYDPEQKTFRHSTPEEWGM